VNPAETADVLGAGQAGAAGIPDFRIEEGRYCARFARVGEDVEAALRLRYRVFNLELGEGLEESHRTGLDRDRFDAQCHHLLVEDMRSGSVVGTYRLQTAAAAAGGEGFYTDQEYDLDPWRGGVLEDSVEIGRACIDKLHRQGLVLLLLWQGLGAYANHHGKGRLFGCCSITSQDAAEGWRVFEHLRRNEHLHPDLRVRARSGFRLVEYPATTEGSDSVRLPKLFRTYLRYGAKVCSEPALDRAFKTIDYLTLLDLRALDPERILAQFAEYVRKSA
jgi:putative hemolysin